MKTKKLNRKNRSITISLDNYKELEKLKAELIGHEGDPNLSYNDVISYLLKDRKG